jgi:hypothetical protein
VYECRLRLLVLDILDSFVRNARLGRPAISRGASPTVYRRGGAKVAQIDLARRLSEAIWHMLSRGEPFAPKGATDPLAA